MPCPAVLGRKTHVSGADGASLLQQAHAAPQPAVTYEAGAQHAWQQAAVQKQPGLPAAGLGGDEHALNTSGQRKPQEASAHARLAAAAGSSPTMAPGGCALPVRAPDQASHEQPPHQAVRTVLQSSRLHSKDTPKNTFLAGGDLLEIQVDAGSSAILRSLRMRPSPCGTVRQAKGTEAAQARDDAQDSLTTAQQRPAGRTGSGPLVASAPPDAFQEAEVTHPTTPLSHF